MRINDESIRLIMYRKGLTQTELSRRSGFSRNTIGSICNGKSCSESTAQRIAQAIGVDLTEIAR